MNRNKWSGISKRRGFVHDDAGCLSPSGPCLFVYFHVPLFSADVTIKFLQFYRHIFYSLSSIGFGKCHFFCLECPLLLPYSTSRLSWWTPPSIPNGSVPYSAALVNTPRLSSLFFHMCLILIPIRKSITLTYTLSVFLAYNVAKILNCLISLYLQDFILSTTRSGQQWGCCLCRTHPTGMEASRLEVLFIALMPSQVPSIV